MFRFRLPFEASARMLGGGFPLVAVLACWMGLASPLCAAGAKFTASLDRNSVVLGETVALTLQFEGGAPRGVPALPQIPGLQVGPGISTSMNTSLGPDGAMTSVQAYTLTLVPQRAGDFVIPSLSADVEGQMLRSQPLTLKVLQSDPSAPAPETAEKLAFLSLVVPKSEVYVGEVLVAELRLYLRGDVRNISEVQIPALAGGDFISGKYVQGKQYQRRVGNTPFIILPFSITLTPLKSGSLPLGPLEGSVVVHLPVSGRRNLDPFNIDSFFGPRTEPRKVELNLAQQTLQVRAVPSDKAPPGFSGAVGQYTMAFGAGPTNVAVGDPITVKIQISGQGSLDALTLPDLSSWRDFKAYPPTIKVENQDALGIQGTKSFEQVVVPQTTELKELPAFAFSFFDPEQRTFRTLQQPATPLTVRPGGSVSVPTMVTTVGGAQASPPPTQDIVPIKQRLGAVAQIGAPLPLRPWFLALQGLPLLTLLSAVFWRRATEKLANNPRLRRRRQVTVAIRKGLSDLRQLSEQNKSDEFFGTLVRLLQEQLGERLDLPASAITEAVVDERLRPRGVPESTLAPLQELFQTCNLARYAPLKTSHELAAIIPKLEVVLNELRDLKV